VHEISRPQLAVYAAAAIAIALVGARYLHRSTAPVAGPASAPPARVQVQGAAGGRAVVQVAGAVRRPGVYRLGPGARVIDAVRRAGGATRHADVTAVNLAARLEDGRQIIVPRRGRGPPAAAGATAGMPGAGAGAGAPAQPVDLNTASAEQLDALDGVGPETARKIMAYRAQHGGFRSVDELDQVPGIGAKRLAALRPLVRV
jgi:competence protein ComEA